MEPNLQGRIGIAGRSQVLMTWTNDQKWVKPLSSIKCTKFSFFFSAMLTFNPTDVPSNRLSRRGLSFLLPGEQYFSAASVAHERRKTKDVFVWEKYWSLVMSIPAADCSILLAWWPPLTFFLPLVLSKVVETLRVPLFRACCGAGGADGRRFAVFVTTVREQCLFGRIGHGFILRNAVLDRL